MMLLSITFDGITVYLFKLLFVLVNKKAICVQIVIFQKHMYGYLIFKNTAVDVFFQYRI